MSTRISINAIMCENVDAKVTRIDNIFNSAKTDKDGRLSFNVVTFVNCVGDPIDFSLAFLLQHRTNKNGGPIAFLNAIEYTYEGGEIASGSSQSIDTTYYPNVNLDGEGSYCLIVCKYDADELVEMGIDFKNDHENWVEKLEYDHIACVYEFEVSA